MFLLVGWLLITSAVNNPTSANGGYMNLQELLNKKSEVKSGSTGMKASEVDFNCDQKTGIATLNADFDINKLLTEGKSTQSGKEKFANCTISIPGMPIRFTGNCFVKIK